MPYSFFVEILFMASLAAMIFIFASAIPKIEEEEAGPRKENLLDRLAKKIPLDKIDDNLDIFREKLLRRVKVFLMKATNLVDGRLGKKNKPPANNSQNGSNGNGILG
jgi:hypothetical protein